GLSEDQAKVMAEAIDVLRREGAVIVDPADIPSVVDPEPDKNFLTWNICSGAVGAKANDSACSVVFKYGMKRDFNAWLRWLRPGYPTLIVPFGLVRNIQTPPFPDGFEARPAPFGVSFAGMACSEPRLIEIGYAFEQATRRRVPPF